MRLFEFATRVKLFATKRYLKNAALYARGGYPNFVPTLRAFLEAKLRQPLTPVGKKDEPFTGGPFKGKGIWHAHMIHGKVVVVYSPSVSAIHLYDLIEHSQVDSPAADRLLYNFIVGAALEPMDPPVARLTITDDQQQSFDTLLGFMVEQDRDILEAAVKGDFDGLVEFVALVPLPWDALLERMGGKTAMRKYIKSIL